MARIFIVEAECIIAEHLSTLVAGLGHEVLGQAESAADVLRQLATLPAPPDLLLLDVHLHGEFDGIDLAVCVRANGGPPFVFVTSSTAPAAVARAAPATSSSPSTTLRCQSPWKWPWQLASPRPNPTPPW